MIDIIHSLARFTKRLLGYLRIQSGAQIHATNFFHTDLSGAIFDGATLNGAILLGAKLDGANLEDALTLEGTYMREVKNYDDPEKRQRCIDKGAKFDVEWARELERKLDRLDITGETQQDEQ